MSGGNLALPMSISATSRRTINLTASWCRSRWRWGHDSGQALTYVYFEEEPGRQSVAKQLSKDEARRMAANIAPASGYAANDSRHQLSGGAQGPACDRRYIRRDMIDARWFTEYPEPTAI